MLTVISAGSTDDHVTLDEHPMDRDTVTRLKFLPAKGKTFGLFTVPARGFEMT